MKHLGKIVVVAAIAALSLSCASALAKGDSGKTGKLIPSAQLDSEETSKRGGKDGAKKPELTEEEKAERAEKAKEKLAEKLEEGKITQEEYDAELEKIESGDFEHDRKGGKGHSKPQSKTENAAATE